MAAAPLTTLSNLDLTVLADNKPRWNQPDHRRHGFHNLHRLARYAMSLRAPRVLALEKRIDRRIGEMPEVRRLTGTTCFSGMVVVRGQHILHEAYAADFGPRQPHSIQSITKTTMSLIMGRLIGDGLVDPARKVLDYVPEIGTGYGDATVQQVMNMDVANNYTEDYHDPFTSSYLQEAAMGWRLPPEGEPELTIREFVQGITSEDVTNRTGHAIYKSANTDVLAWIAEKVSGERLRRSLTEVVEAAGIEGAFHITTDRDGVPAVDGGGCLTARDLARYGLLFARLGLGVDGTQLVASAYLERTRHEPGPAMPRPRDWLHYSNQAQTDGRWLGHGGYGGQYMLADPDSGVVVVFFSVLEDRDAYDEAYYPEVIRMADEIVRLPY